jgi:hypothetical protein
MDGIRPVWRGVQPQFTGHERRTMLKGRSADERKEHDVEVHDLQATSKPQIHLMVHEIMLSDHI